MMKKILFFIVLLLTFTSIPKVFAGVGVGMGPTKLDLRTTVGNPYSVTVIVYNPGDYDIKAKLTFQCANCEENATFLGWHIGTIKSDYRQFFSFEPEEVYVVNGTGPGNAVPIKVNIHPGFFVRKDLVISTPEEINFLVKGANPGYDGKFSIPYYVLLIDEHRIKGGLTISTTWSTFGQLGAIPAVGADFSMVVKGIPLGSLLIIIIVIICVIIFALWRIGFKKVYGFFRRKSR